MKLSAGLVLLTTLLTPAIATADVSIREQAVVFKKGESATTIGGSIKGDQIVDYRLSAGAGQSMRVDFKPDNLSAYFNLTAPDANAAMFIGSVSGNRFEGRLPVSGIYTIRVYLMRNAARRNETAHYMLEVGIAPGRAAAAQGSGGPSKWDASGTVRCSFGNVSLDRQCDFRVVRDRSRQAADVWLSAAGKGKEDFRFLHYDNKSFTTNDAERVSWRRSDDNWLVTISDQEVYLIPDALLHGG